MLRCIGPEEGSRVRGLSEPTCNLYPENLKPFLKTVSVTDHGHDFLEGFLPGYKRVGLSMNLEIRAVLAYAEIAHVGSVGTSNGCLDLSEIDFLVIFVFSEQLKPP